MQTAGQSLHATRKAVTDIGTGAIRKIFYRVVS